MWEMRRSAHSSSDPCCWDWHGMLMNCTYLLSFQVRTHDCHKPKRYLWGSLRTLTPAYQTTLKSHHIVAAFTHHYPTFNLGQPWPGRIINWLPIKWAELVPQGSNTKEAIIWSLRLLYYYGCTGNQVLKDLIHFCIRSHRKNCLLSFTPTNPSERSGVEWI